jgi:hypothetical protein
MVLHRAASRCSRMAGAAVIGPGTFKNSAARREPALSTGPVPSVEGGPFARYASAPDGLIT